MEPASGPFFPSPFQDAMSPSRVLGRPLVDEALWFGGKRLIRCNEILHVSAELAENVTRRNATCEQGMGRGGKGLNTKELEDADFLASKYPSPDLCGLARIS